MRLFAVVALALAVALGGCSSKMERQAKLDPFAGTGSPYYKGSGKIPIGGGKRHVGKPYKVAGRLFTPKEQPNYDKVGMSSWYGEAFHRRRTSNGEYFDMNELTAAHATLPLPSYARVTNMTNGKSVVVRINDRGPFVGTRIIDVSKRTASMLDYKHKGTEKVRVQYIGPAPLNDPGGRDLLAMNKGTRRQATETMIADIDTQPSPQRTTRRRQTLMAANSEPATTDYQQNVSASSTYFIDLGTYADPDNVQRIRDGLSGIGPMQVSEFDGAQGPAYRLRIGPIADLDQATTAYNEAQSFGIPDARITVNRYQQAALQ